MNYPILQLKPKRERSILLKHPWIFSGALEKLPKAEEGEIVEVRSQDKKILGYGFYSSHSQISCRMFDWKNEQGDFENETYWNEKVQHALALRKTLINTEHTNTYRLIHAEGDFMPGIIVDIYKEVAVIQILIKGVEKRKQLIVAALNKAGFPNIYLKTKAGAQNVEAIDSSSGWLSGKGEEEIIVKENDVLFKVNIVTGQKTGFFIDQRDSRAMLAQLAKDKTVLNTFCYTGGFSAYAFAGGAKEVHSVDISEEAIKMTDENVALNFPKAKHTSTAVDCFEFLKDMPENFYDLIVLDPPAFAKNARAVDKAARGYKEINMKAFQKIKSGGILFTFSCSQNISKDLFQKIIFGAAADIGRNVRIIHQLTQPGDHPVNIYHPEGEYLKGLVLWVE